MRRSRHALALSIIFGFLAPLSCAHASTESEDGKWNADLPVYLTATLYYRNTDDARDRRAIASILAELRLKHGDWSIGPVVELHRTVNARDDTTVSAGVIVRHDHRRWDTTALVFRQMPLRAPYTWSYGARLRYRVSSSGKLGAEMFGAIDRMESSDLMFGYYGDISPALSFRLVAGTTVNQRNSRAVRMDLVLQVN